MTAKFIREAFTASLTDEDRAARHRRRLVNQGFSLVNTAATLAEQAGDTELLQHIEHFSASAKKEQIAMERANYQARLEELAALEASLTSS